MRHILLIWHDRDGSRTVHEFDTVAAAEPWLRSVLQDVVSPEELAEAGYTPDGIGMLGYHTDQGLDEVGGIEAFIDGMGVTPDALCQ